MRETDQEGPEVLLDPDLAPGRIRAAIAARRTGTLRTETQVDDDDCAVLDLAGSPKVVLSTDFINASPIGLEQGFATLADLGWLCVAVNVADVLSSGARPVAILLAVVLERGSTLAEFDDLVAGVLDGCEELGVELVGGDTKLGRSRAINGTCIGVLGESGSALLRSEARIGDDLWLLGTVGETAAATLLLDEGVSGPIGEACRDQVRRPTLRLETLQEAVEGRMLRSGTDVSDGLVADAHAIARASGVRLVIDAADIPVSALVRTAVERGLGSGLGLQLSIGGDLSFLATAPATSSDALAELGFVRIGKVTGGAGVGIIRQALESELQFEGHRDSRRMTFAQEIRYLAGIYED